MLKHYDLKLVEPEFDSELTDLIIELDYLRKKELGGSTHPMVFFQLKRIFHTLESIGSARIEGNKTTVAEYIETKLDEKPLERQELKEIRNIEEAMTFIEGNVEDYSINRFFLSEMHKMIVKELIPPPNGEGDKFPGEFRESNVRIAKSQHEPPDWTRVADYMSELIDFIQEENESKYDLLKTAIAHHRFVWIHPFGNGNGRTVRLLTYAMLVKLGFNVNVGRILNPAAVFCSNRDDYYSFLSKADSGSKQDVLDWCQYVLTGLKDEIEKIDKLLDYEFLRKEILLPAINYSLDRKLVTPTESKILKRVIDRQVIKAGDLKDIFVGKLSAEISRQIKKLIERKMLMSEEEGKRSYILRFDNNYLIRGIFWALDQKGFLPVRDEAEL